MPHYDLYSLRATSSRTLSTEEYIHYPVLMTTHKNIKMSEYHNRPKNAMRDSTWKWYRAFVMKNEAGWSSGFQVGKEVSIDDS